VKKRIYGMQSATSVATMATITIVKECNDNQMLIDKCIRVWRPLHTRLKPYFTMQTLAKRVLSNCRRL